MNQILKSFKAIHDLGLPKLWYYTLYQVGLRTGHYRRVTPSRRAVVDTPPRLSPYANFPAISEGQRYLVLAEAHEIQQGHVRLFGGEPVPFDLKIGASQLHWTELEQTPPDQDIKFIWEPGRFGWAVTLARAYAFSDDQAYARDFWNKANLFLAAHPPNLGRQWQSAQEVAIRLMALIFCDQVFANAASSSHENRKRIWEAIAEHAQRIPPTLVYARAQNNNHLCSEAAGLYAAGLYLPDHPQAENWRQSGWAWLNDCFQNQIDEFGTYTQHSTNYHRLMLHLALYTDHLRQTAGEPDWPLSTRSRLAAATRWLWALTDPTTGRVPNLGANDGAYIFPLTHLPFADFRPVVNAAAKAFLGQDLYQKPELDEMADWFNLTAADAPDQTQPQAADMLRMDNDHSRAFIHSARFSDRPSHADQLHIDLWWRGVNVALDPGTFQYNAQPPWDNALATAGVHNTLTVDGHDQMTRAGRFLWLDWAQAQILTKELDGNGQVSRVTAEHDGYHRLGISHQRTLTAQDNGWIIADTIVSSRKPDHAAHDVRLTWLLPDWEWKFISDHVLRLTSPVFNFQLQIEGAAQISVFRAGECLHGNLPPHPTWGWYSSTYGVKNPTLLVIADQSRALPINLRSTWRFDNQDQNTVKDGN